MDDKNKDVLFYLLKKYTVLLYIQHIKANERMGERSNLAICGTDRQNVGREAQIEFQTRIN